METGSQMDTASKTEEDSSTQKENISPEPWYKDKVYQKYWDHHKKVTSWFKSMITNYRQHQCLEYYRAMAQYHTAMADWLRQMESYYTNWYQTWLEHQQLLTNQACYQQTMSSNNHHKAGLKRSRSKQWKVSDKRQKKNIPSTPNSQQSTESDEFEMEITPDMLDFFRHSARHKKERDLKKKEDEESQDERIDIAEVNTGKNRATILPPGDRPGLKRTMEMRLLYGKGAAMIHGMETAMQLNYDRNCDMQQPKLWPQLPINISFT